MAVDYAYVWCVQFGEAPDYWLSSLGTFEPYGSASFSCARTWTVIKTADFVALQASASGGTTSPQFTTEEVSALKYMAANPSPFNLSVEDGYLVSGSIVGVWVVAWAFRALYLTLRSDGEPTE